MVKGRRQFGIKTNDDSQTSYSTSWLVWCSLSNTRTVSYSKELFANSGTDRQWSKAHSNKPATLDLLVAVTSKATQLLLLVYLTACGARPQDADLLVYADWWESENMALVGDLELSFVDKPGTVIGCANSRRARFDTTFWRYASEEQRRAVFAHELGHALYGRGHIEVLRPDGSGCPLSVMGSVLMPARCWEDFESDYLGELRG